MPDKKVCLYDSTNQPLMVKGIRVELYDASTKSYIDGDNSDDLKPGAGPATWGVVLTFLPGSTPVDIYVSDPKYTYPGNTMRHLNGDLGDEVFMDLMALPSSPGGQQPSPASPASGEVRAINQWIDGHGEWKEEQRQAVRNLVFNYAQILPFESIASTSGEFRAMLNNWETALKRTGFQPESLKRTPKK
jgi:hypothetical protein